MKTILILILIVFYIIILSIIRHTIVYEPITVVICNYDRPNNVQRIVAKLKKIYEINEIIITHGKPDTFRKFEDCINIKNYKLNDLYGATHRFFTTDYITNDIVLFIDDDHIPSYTLVCNLLKQMKKDPLSICGIYKRRCDHNGYKTSPDTYNNIITPIMMTHKSIILNYQKNFYKYEDFLYNTKGNSEDLSFNHNYISQYKKYPIYVDGKYNSYLPQENGFTYSKQANHYKIRNKFCKDFYKNI